MRNSRRFPTRATAAHIRELSSMSVESVCCSSSSRAAPADGEGRSGHAANGKAAHNYPSDNSLCSVRWVPSESRAYPEHLGSRTSTHEGAEFVSSRNRVERSRTALAR